MARRPMGRSGYSVGKSLQVEMEETLIAVIGFRNVQAPKYEMVTPEQVSETLQTGLGVEGAWLRVDPGTGTTQRV